MNKLEFLDALHKKLSGLPAQEIEERLTFYNEIIQDGMDEGLTEEEAVARIGNIDDIVADIPKDKQAKQAISPWMVALLILGSPLWVSLLAAVFAVGVSLFVSLWSVIISLWATEVALWGSALGGLVLGIIQICTGSGWAGIGYIGIALVCAGTSLLLFYGCKATTKGAVLLTKTVTVKITNCIRKKEGNK